SILEREDYDITLAEDGREAANQFETNVEKFDLLVLDCTMPKLSGTDIYRKVRVLRTNLPVILISGYHQEQVIVNIGSDPYAWFIKKPFNVDEFLNGVEGALQTA
ncbi:MAG: response regulator, partial [Pseudomonadales bacterium]|nr:response regulator [Pseudomonadales bacterium]